MLREVSDLSSRSYSDDDSYGSPLDNPKKPSFVKLDTPAEFELCKSHDNPLNANAIQQMELRADDVDEQAKGLLDSENSAELSGARGQVRFNTAFEAEADSIHTQ